MTDLAARLTHARPAMAEAMIAAGATMAVAYAALPILQDALAGALTGDAPIDDAMPPEPDWSALAARAGERVDLPAWQAREVSLAYHASADWQPAQREVIAE